MYQVRFRVDRRFTRENVPKFRSYFVLHRTKAQHSGFWLKEEERRSERAFAASVEVKQSAVRDDDVARWSSGQDGGLSRLKREFDSPTGHHLQFHSLYLAIAIYIVGAFNGEGPPVPIPNTAVKLTCAYNTCLETSREDRSAPTLRDSLK